MLAFRAVLILAILIPPFLLTGWGPTLVTWALSYPVVSLLFGEGPPTTRARAAWLLPVLPIYLAFGLFPQVTYRPLIRVPLTGEDRPEYSWYGDITTPSEFLSNHVIDPLIVKGLYLGLALIAIVLLLRGRALARELTALKAPPPDAGWLSPGALAIAVAIAAMGASLSWTSVESRQTGRFENYERVSRGWPMSFSEVDDTPMFGGRHVYGGAILGNMLLAIGLGVGAGHVLRVIQRRREERDRLAVPASPALDGAKAGTEISSG